MRVRVYKGGDLPLRLHLEIGLLKRMGKLAVVILASSESKKSAALVWAVLRKWKLERVQSEYLSQSLPETL